MKRKPLKKLWHHSQQILQSVRRIFRQYMPSVSIPFGVLLVVFLIRQFRPFLPNLLELSDRGVASSLLTAVAGILASILGIVVAILIVALELLRRTYSRYGFSTIFRDRHLIDLVALYSVTIVVALFVAAQLSDPLTLTDATQCNFVFGLFVLSVTILFPYCKAVIIETHSEKRIKSLVAEIDMHSIYEILPDPVNEPCERDGEVARNPIYILGQAVARFIQDDDRVSAQVLIISTTSTMTRIPVRRVVSITRGYDA